jgi:hypothetical protein
LVIVLIILSPSNHNGLRFNSYNSCSAASDSTQEFFGGQFGNNYPQGSASQVGADTVFVKKACGTQSLIPMMEWGQRSISMGCKNVQQKVIPFTPNSNNLFIGRQENPAYPFLFNGVIDEIRIYNRALPPPAVTLLNKLTN